jgi:hypothetical protein
MTEPTPASRLLLAQRALLAILIMGFAGAGVELLLLEHTEDTWQLVPLLLIPPSIASLVWYAMRRSVQGKMVLRAIMLLNVLAGAVGTYLHFRGNVEFELEMSPGLAGFALFRDAMMGATPALAPGSMAMFGLIGLVYASLLSESRS